MPHVEQRAQARTAAVAHDGRPWRTKARLRPISGTTSATVASATRSRLGEKVRLATHAAERPGARSSRVKRHERQEHDAGRAEMAEAGEIVLAVGIDDGDGRRQRLGRLVVIDHDGVEAEALGLRQRLVARGAAIDGDEEARAALLERADGFDVGAVALDDAVGDVDDERHAAMAQERAERGRTRRRRRSRRRSPPCRRPDGVSKAAGSHVHVGEAEGSGRRSRSFGARNTGTCPAARRVRPARAPDIGHAVRLRDSERMGPRIRPAALAASGGRAPSA